MVLGCDDSDNMEQALQVTALVMRCYKSDFMGSDLMASPTAKVHPHIPQGISCVQKQGGESAICMNLKERKKLGDRTCDTR